MAEKSKVIAFLLWTFVYFAHCQVHEVEAGTVQFAGKTV